MSRALLEKLSVTQWTPTHNAAVAYGTGGAVETPPAVAANADGTTQFGTRYRFVRIQAHDADLLVHIDKAGGATLPGSGSIRVYAGSAEIFQLPEGAPSVNLAAVSGTANGAVIWGR